MLCQIYGFDIECARRVSLLHRDIDADDPGVIHANVGDYVSALVSHRDIHWLANFPGEEDRACNGLPPLSAWIQPSEVLSTVRAQIPTLLVPSSELGSSSAMLQTFLSLKKSSPVNCM